jgi:hypothetical protein
MTNSVVWDVTPCGSCTNRRFGGTRIGELGTTLAVTSNRRTLRRNTHLVFPVTCYWYVVSSRFLRSVRRMLVTANVVPSSPILVSLMMEALCSSETSVPTRATRRNIPEDAILHSHCRENFKSYVALTGWTL